MLRVRIDAVPIAYYGGKALACLSQRGLPLRLISEIVGLAKRTGNKVTAASNVSHDCLSRCRTVSVGIGAASRYSTRVTFPSVERLMDRTPSMRDRGRLHRRTGPHRRYLPGHPALDRRRTKPNRVPGGI